MLILTEFLIQLIGFRGPEHTGTAKPVLVEMQVLKIVLTKLVSLTASSRDKEVLIECLMFIDS